MNDKQKAGLLFLIPLALWYPFGLLVCVIHEAGHATICEYEHYPWKFDYNVLTGCSVSCPPSGANDTLNNMMGGVFGTLLSIGIFGIGTIVLKKKYAIGVVLAALAIMYLPDQISKIVIEGFYFHFYKSVTGLTLVTMIQGASIIAGLIFIMWKNKKHLKQKN